MTAITAALSSALLHFVWQGFVVAGLLWIALFALRNRSANARYAVSCLALSVLFLLPVITVAVRFEPAAAVADSPAEMAAVTLLDVSAVASPGVLQAPWLTWIQSWALTAWSIGVLLFSLRIVWGCNYIYTLKRRGQSADSVILDVVDNLARKMGIGRHVRVLMSSIADGPSVVGWLRPVILLPASSVFGLTPEQLEAVVAHELAHIRRYDYLVSAFQVGVETLLFYHPAVWWTSSRIRHERELCCDDLAVRACGDALCYARALTKLEKLRVVKPTLVLGSTDGSLLYRIQRIIGEKTMEYGPSKLSGALVVLLALGGLAVNQSWFSAQASPQEVKLFKQEQSTGVNVNLGAATVLHRSEVEYPEAAMKKGIQGSVSVEASTDGTGNVVDARVLSGPVELRKAALESVLNWHFAGGQKTQVVHLSFDLEAAKKAIQNHRVALAFEPEFRAYVHPENEAEHRRELSQEDALKHKLELAMKEAGEVDHLRAIELDKMRHNALDDHERQARMEVELANKLAQEKFDGQLLDAKDKLDLELALTQKLRALHSPENRVIGGIDIAGLPDASRQDLASKLGLRVGDTLTRESLERAQKAVVDFDEHLELRVHYTEEGKAEIRITAPGHYSIEVYRSAEPLKRKP